MYNHILQKIRSHKTALFALACYFVLIAAYYPKILMNPNGIMAGLGGDSFMYIWNIWWVKKAVFEFGANPFFCNYIAHPFDSNLVFSGLILINSLIGAFVAFFSSITFAFNFIFISSLILLAFGTYILLKYLTKNHLVSLIGGLMIISNSFIMDKFRDHLIYTFIWELPFFILFFIKFIKQGKMKHGILAGCLLAASFYNNFHFFLGISITGLMIFIYYFLSDKELISNNLKSWAVFIMLSTLLILPLFYFSLNTLSKSSYSQVKLWQVALYAPDIRSFIVPSSQNLLIGNIFQNYYSILSYHGSIIYVGYVLIFFSIIGIIFRKKWDTEKDINLWFLIALAFIFFTLGPFLCFNDYYYKWQGVTFTIPLPYFLFFLLPLVKGVLATPRYAIFLIFSLIVLVCITINRITLKIKNQTIKTLFLLSIAGLFIFENCCLPLPVSSTTVPGVYYEISQETGDYAILELPYALSTSYYTVGKVNVSSKLQYYQTVHNKKILNGWIARVPNEYYTFFQSLTGLDYLIDPMAPAGQKKINMERQKIIKNFKNLKIKYVIIHPEYYNHFQLRNTLDFLNEIYKTEPELQDGLLIYNLIKF